MVLGGKIIARVMVVDDERDLREMIGILLKKEGFESQTAENGEDLLTKVEDFQPDLVTLDVMMPGLKTREILEKLKEKSPKTKIILLTVIRFSGKEKQKIYKMGNVVDYVKKPFDIDDLLYSIKKAF
jgi:DNA-binding response OmpR family regulator